MKKNVLVKVGEREEQRTRLIPAEYDETGELILEAYEETYTVTVPIMEAQNVEMTEDEIEEMRRLAAEAPTPAPTAEERMTEIEAALIELAGIMGGE